MRNIRWAAAALLATGAFGQTARDHIAQERVLRIPRVTGPLHLTDFLRTDSPLLQRAAKVTDFRQNNPNDGEPPTEETTAYVAYDDLQIYFVFLCHAPAGDLRARVTRREDLFPDDMVGVNLDTFHDRQRTFFFYVNPRAVQLDGLYTEGSGDESSWDTVWRSEAEITPFGYAALMAIPFKSLRFPLTGTQQWGIALTRQIPRKNEYVWWPHICNRENGFAHQLATLEGLESISPGRNLQLMPYGFLARSRFLNPADSRVPLRLSDATVRGGLDGKVVLRDSLALDLTLNPDFSQVESDEPQVTVNQRFEVLFPERRPFFLENAAYFRTPIDLFFSRRVADPEYGSRLTGKLGRWALGVMAIDDRAPKAEVGDSQPLADTRAGIAVVRASREFGRQSRIGVLATDRELPAGFNRVFSFDSRVRLSTNWILQGQWARSYTRRPNGERLSGPAYLASLTRDGRHLFFQAKYDDKSPDFYSDLGFIPRVDVRQVESTVAYSFRPAGKPVLRYTPIATVLENWDRRGRVQDRRATAGLSVELRGPTYLEVFRNEAFELFDDIGFRKGWTTVSVFSERYRRTGLRARYVHGSEINYDAPEGVAPFLGSKREASLGVLLRPCSRFRMENTYLFSRLADGPAVFNNHILRTKVYYQFNREFSLRAILDYNGVLPNAELADLDRSKRLVGDVLFTYLLRPGTAIYAGYTDRYENYQEDALQPERLRRFGGPVFSTGRQFFVKASYLFRF